MRAGSGFPLARSLFPGAGGVTASDPPPLLDIFTAPVDASTWMLPCTLCKDTIGAEAEADVVVPAESAGALLPGVAPESLFAEDVA